MLGLCHFLVNLKLSEKVMVLAKLLRGAAIRSWINFKTKPVTNLYQSCPPAQKLCLPPCWPCLSSPVAQVGPVTRTAICPNGRTDLASVQKIHNASSRHTTFLPPNWMYCQRDFDTKIIDQSGGLFIYQSCQNLLAQNWSLLLAETVNTSFRNLCLLSRTLAYNRWN